MGSEFTQASIPGKISAFLRQGVDREVFPGAVLLVWQKDHGLFSEKVGYRALEPYSSPMKEDTIFDLASLTKPLATTLAIMELVDGQKLKLSQTLETFFPQTIPERKRSITLRDLLAHQSGLPSWRPFYKMFAHHNPEVTKKKVREWILFSCPLDYEPCTKALYSDLDFMLLEWIVEITTEKSLSAYLESGPYKSFSLETMFLYQRRSPLPNEDKRFAATERCRWREQILCGVVHDENAYAMGGYSGHAGLFGTALDVFRLAHLLMEHYLGKRDDWLRPQTVRAFFSPQETKGATWALGWDTPSDVRSSSGRHFSKRSVGHLGFTGCSLWMDLEKALIVVLLTNRVHPTRDNQKIKEFRPLLHDLVVDQLGLVE